MSDFSAVASALGYMYQPRMALLQLLKASGNAELHLEKFDDLSIGKDGKIESLYQLKHKKSGSLDNTSPDLWKTIRIWTNNYKKGIIEFEKSNLVLITTGKAKTGSIASLLKIKNRNPKQARMLLDQQASESGNKKLKESFKIYLGLKENERDKLVNRIKIIDKSPDIIDVKQDILFELKRVTKRKYLEKLFSRLEEWWNEKILQHLYYGTDEPILSSTLEAKIDDLREQFFSNNLPIDYRKFELKESDTLSAKQKIFVEQLILISLSQPRIMSAIRDYYRAFNQISRWTREDLLNIGEFDQYKDALEEEWKNHFDVMNEILGESPDKQAKIFEGKKLYNWASLEATRCIREKCTEPYVIRGTYQLLAEDKRVGWHTDFVQELEKILVEKKK